MYKCINCNYEPTFSYKNDMVVLSCLCEDKKLSIECNNLGEFFIQQKVLKDKWNKNIQDILKQQKTCSVCGKVFEYKEDAEKCAELDNKKFKYNVGDIVTFLDYNDDHVGYVRGEILAQKRLRQFSENYNDLEIPAYGELGYKIKYGCFTTVYILESDVHCLLIKADGNIDYQNMISGFNNIATEYFKKYNIEIAFSNMGKKISIILKKEQ